MKAFRPPAPHCVLWWGWMLLLGLPTAPAGAADPAVASLDEQIIRAQADHDEESIVELCRRRLDSPGAEAGSLLKAIFYAQLELKDLSRAAQTLDRWEKTQRSAVAVVAEARGDLLRAQDKPLDEALVAWRMALAADPTELVGLLGKIADAFDEAGRWEEAAGAFRAVLRLAPGHAARQARLAVCLLNAGHAAEADKEMQAAVRADAADATVKAFAPIFDRLRPEIPLLRKLEARIAAGNLPGSNPTVDVGARANTVESASLDRAVSLYRAGAYAGALPDARRAAREMGGLSRAAQILEGQCFWQLNQDKEAAALGVAKIVDKRWFDDETRFNRLRAADKAPRLNADVTAVRAFTVRATVLLEADQPALALDDASRAHELNDAKRPRLDDPEVVYAVTLLRNNRIEEALAAARRATEHGPNNPDGWAVLGRVEQEARADFAAAAEHLTHALSLREEPRWLRRREICLRTMGRNAEADRDAKRLAELSPVS